MGMVDSHLLFVCDDLPGSLDASPPTKDLPGYTERGFG